MRVESCTVLHRARCARRTGAEFVSRVRWNSAWLRRARQLVTLRGASRRRETKEDQMFSIFKNTCTTICVTRDILFPATLGRETPQRRRRRWLPSNFHPWKRKKNRSPFRARPLTTLDLAPDFDLVARRGSNDVVHVALSGQLGHTLDLRFREPRRRLKLLQLSPRSTAHATPREQDTVAYRRAIPYRSTPLDRFISVESRYRRKRDARS